MKQIALAIMILVTSATAPALANTPEVREQRREQLQVIRRYDKQVSGPRAVAMALVIGGMLSGALQVISPPLVWGEAAFPMVFFGLTGSAGMVTLGGLVAALSDGNLERYTKNSLVTSEPHFRWFLDLPEEQQLDYLDQRPDLAQFIARLAYRAGGYSPYRAYAAKRIAEERARFSP